MGSKELSSNLADDVRNMSISRRGGVRTRGGRLPPIRMRDIAQVTGAKKVIAPKIPQRRIQVKQEISEEFTPLIKKELFVEESKGRSRGRGRGSKTFVQLEGTFLADGPAARIKKEPESESYSIPRYSRSYASEKMKVTLDLETMDDLLHSYKPNSGYEDDFGSIPPYRLPLLKDEVIQKIKAEPLDEDDIKTEVKQEDNTWNKLEGKVFTKLKTELKTEAQAAAEGFFNADNEGKLFLLQFPSCLPFDKSQPNADSTGEDQKKEGESKTTSAFDSLPEGRIGKFQIMKSGKRRLVLGSLSFQLIEGAQSESLKEVVTIRTNEDGGDITVLGKIERTMVVRPVIDEILGMTTL